MNYTIWIYAFSSILLIWAIGLIALLIYIRATKEKRFSSVTQEKPTSSSITEQSGQSKRRNVSSRNKLISQFCVSLAVASLAGDAIMHLMPQAIYQPLPAKIDIQHVRAIQTRIVWKSFVVMAMIVALFLFEKFMSLIGSMSGQKAKDSEYSTFQKEGDVEKGLLSGKSNKMPSNQGRRISVNAWTCIIGDALHSFFDGLAIAVAYSGNITSGLSTTIAISCHEFPHILGDFAFLTQTGLSKKLSLAFNGFFILCALLGCLMGLIISQLRQNENPKTVSKLTKTAMKDGNDPQSWIFCIISGMFLYLALSNMIPELRQKTDTTEVIRKYRYSVDENMPSLSGDGEENGENLSIQQQSNKRVPRIPRTNELKRHEKKYDEELQDFIEIEPPKKWGEALSLAVIMVGLIIGTAIMLLLALYENKIKDLLT